MTTAMDPELLKWFASLGVGGALAGGMFLAYRKDVLGKVDRTEIERATLLEVIARHAKATEHLAGALESHHQTEVATMDRIEGYSREAMHDVKNLLDRTARPKYIGP